MTTRADLIAACGMNCGICLAYLRERNQCPGCRDNGPGRLAHFTTCIIRNCETVKESPSGFCYECPRLPCRRLKALDKRYRTKYGMSMLQNLEHIRVHGVSAFVERENERWRCDGCGGVICVHRGICFQCGQKPD